MADIRDLNTINTSLSGDDLLRVYDRSVGGEVAASVDTLKAYVTADSAALATQYAAPTATGFTVTITAANTWLVLTPAAGYAAGTIALPASASTGDEVLVNCTQSVSTLTISGGTVAGAPASLSANGFFRLRYEGVTGNWYRVG